MRTPARAVTLSGLVLMMLASTGCGGKYSTPEATFSAMQAAAQKKDIPGMMDCLTDESQKVLTGGMVMMASMMKMMGGMAAMGGGEQAAAMQKQTDAMASVLAKHGVTEEAVKAVMPTAQPSMDPPTILKLGDLVDNRPVFIADMFAVMEQFQNGASFSEELETQLAGTLKDVRINGDAATAIVVTTKGEDEIDFRNTPAGWKLHIDLNKMAPASAAPPA